MQVTFSVVFELAQVTSGAWCSSEVLLLAIPELGASALVYKVFSQALSCYTGLIRWCIYWQEQANLFKVTELVSVRALPSDPFLLHRATFMWTRAPAVQHLKARPAWCSASAGNSGRAQMGTSPSGSPTVMPRKPLFLTWEDFDICKHSDPGLFQNQQQKNIKHRLTSEWGLARTNLHFLLFRSYGKDLWAGL